MGAAYDNSDTTTTRKTTKGTNEGEREGSREDRHITQKAKVVFREKTLLIFDVAVRMRTSS